MKSSKTRAAVNPRFRPGAGGACEATLFQFISTRAPEGLDPNIKTVAAIRLDEAYKYMRRRYPEYGISRIEVRELIELVSGSPLD